MSPLQSYDKCFLGSSETADANRVFCGQLGAVYVFSEALNPAQIFAIHQLGPGSKVCALRVTELDYMLVVCISYQSTQSMHSDALLQWLYYLGSCDFPSRKNTCINYGLLGGGAIRRGNHSRRYSCELVSALVVLEH